MAHANNFKQSTLKLVLLFLNCPYFSHSAFILNEVPNLHVWITISSLAHKDPSNSKQFFIRQIELNWINAPLEDHQDYIALYLDSEPDYDSLPVITYRVNNQVHGQITTDYYLPQFDFYNNNNSDSVVDSSTNNDIANNYLQQEEFDHHQSHYYSSRSHPRQQYPERRQSLVDECLGYCLAYISGEKILAKNCFKTNPNWMGDIYQFLGSRSLPSIMLPGTHNSGTYQKFLDKTSLQQINKYLANQEESIFNQLVYGIRYLDIRVGYNNKVPGRHEKLWIYHDVFRTDVSLEEVCQQVKKFLSMTTHEVIIIDFHRFTVGFQNQDHATLREHHHQLVQMITHYLGPYIIPSYLGFHAPISEFVNAGRRLLIGYANKTTIFSSGSPNSITIGRQFVRPSTSISEFDSNSSDGELSWYSRSSGDRYPPMSSSSVANEAALFFPPIWHLWADKDTLAGLGHYMNETTCRKYFGELRSMMAELTPSVFGAIIDKYDGLRRLAQLVNRPVTDWIRDRWWHCVNIVATDFFLGNDLIRLAIHANRLRITRHNTDPNSYTCSSFRKIEHLLNKESIPTKTIRHQHPTFDRTYSDDVSSEQEERGVSIQTRSATNHIYRPHEKRTTTTSSSGGSFVDNVADGFSNIFTSFKRILNL